MRHEEIENDNNCFGACSVVGSE